MRQARGPDARQVALSLFLCLRDAPCLRAALHQAECQGCSHAMFRVVHGEAVSRDQAGQRRCLARLPVCRLRFDNMCTSERLRDSAPVGLCSRRATAARQRAGAPLQQARSGLRFDVEGGGTLVAVGSHQRGTPAPRLLGSEARPGDSLLRTPLGLLRCASCSSRTSTTSNATNGRPAQNGSQWQRTRAWLGTAVNYVCGMD